MYKLINFSLHESSSMCKYRHHKKKKKKKKKTADLLYGWLPQFDSDHMYTYGKPVKEA